MGHITPMSSYNGKGDSDHDTDTEHNEHHNDHQNEHHHDDSDKEPEIPSLKFNVTTSPKDEEVLSETSSNTVSNTTSNVPSGGPSSHRTSSTFAKYQSRRNPHGIQGVGHRSHSNLHSSPHRDRRHSPSSQRRRISLSNKPTKRNSKFRFNMALNDYQSQPKGDTMDINGDSVQMVGYPKTMDLHQNDHGNHHGIDYRNSNGNIAVNSLNSAGS